MCIPSTIPNHEAVFHLLPLGKDDSVLSHEFSKGIQTTLKCKVTQNKFSVLFEKNFYPHFACLAINLLFVYYGICFCVLWVESGMYVSVCAFGRLCDLFILFLFCFVFFCIALFEFKGDN